MFYCIKLIIYVVINLANIVINIHTTTESTICKVARIYFPLSNKSIVSSEKVENEVKPPSIPTVRNRYKLYELMKFSFNNIDNMPIKNEPVALMIINDNGKESNFIVMISRYLIILPISPPIPTAIILNIIIHPDFYRVYIISLF